MGDVGDLEVAIRHRESPDQALARLADDQHGPVAHHQLLSLGLSPAGIQRRVRAKRLHRLHIGVYAVGYRREAGLPRPQTSIWIGEQEVDAVWPDSGIVVERDSYEYHRTRAAFERDRARDASLQVAGYRVLRVTRRRLLGEPAAVGRALRSLLRRP